MKIFLYLPWHDKKDWVKKFNKVLQNDRIVTLEDRFDFSEIECAILWDLPNKIYKKLTNLKIIFTPGAGVDHILKLPSYNKTPIIRLKDPFMAERMSNHVVSQILQYQLNLKLYMESQRNNRWSDFRIPITNSNLKIGILGLGYLGSSVSKTLLYMGYQIQGYKQTKPHKNFKFPVYFQPKNLKKFIETSDVIVSILPATQKTFQFIDKKLFKLMKKKVLFINVGRGSAINEKDLIFYLKKNKQFQVSLDVFNVEPLPKKHPFWKLPNVTITPHVASLTGIESAINQIYTKIKKFKKNKKIKSDVDLIKGY
tara:strand:- start:1689 stop:2621 length:933 start_codon:yes stop_codon:yes gene_type:complete